MKHDMVMPKMGESITEGTIIKWLKQIGDTIEKDEIILEISTDKVDSEIPTPVAGKIVEFLANENDTVEVGKVIARLETEGETESAQPQAEAPPVEEIEEPAPAMEPANTETTPVSEPVATIEEVKPGSTKFFSPVVLNIARTEGVSAEEMESIEGSGISGRVTKKDILNYIEIKKSSATAPVATTPPTTTAPVPSPVISGEGVEIIPMDHIRKKIAEHMINTVHTAAHVGLYIEVDMFNVHRIRENSKNNFYRKEGIKLSYIVPVIKNAESLNLTGIARAINDLASRTRNRKLKPDEVSGGTFSISNFGVFGTKIGFPLINQPQVAILGVGALEKRAIVVNNAIAIRPMMDVSLTFDHRLIDGALGARFLQRLKEHLELYDPELQL